MLARHHLYPHIKSVLLPSSSTELGHPDVPGARALITFSTCTMYTPMASLAVLTSYSKLHISLLTLGENVCPLEFVMWSVESGYYESHAAVLCNYMYVQAKAPLMHLPQGWTFCFVETWLPVATGCYLPFLAIMGIHAAVSSRLAS